MYINTKTGFEIYSTSMDTCTYLHTFIHTRTVRKFWIYACTWANTLQMCRASNHRKNSRSNETKRLIAVKFWTGYYCYNLYYFLFLHVITTCNVIERCANKNIFLLVCYDRKHFTSNDIMMWQQNCPVIEHTMLISLKLNYVCFVIKYLLGCKVHARWN